MYCQYYYCCLNVTHVPAVCSCATLLACDTHSGQLLHMCHMLGRVINYSHNIGVPQNTEYYKYGMRNHNTSRTEDHFISHDNP